MVARDLARITYKLHQQREKIEPNIKLRRKHLESAFHAQLRAERDAIEAHLGRLQPGLRRVYLKSRLEQLDARAKMKPVVGL